MQSSGEENGLRVSLRYLGKWGLCLVFDSAVYDSMVHGFNQCWRVDHTAEKIILKRDHEKFVHICGGHTVTKKIYLEMFSTLQSLMSGSGNEVLGPESSE